MGHGTLAVEDGLPLLGPDPTAEAALQRLNRHLLPVFLTMATFCYIDRTNLAFASLQLNKDLAFTPEVYGLGSGLFFVGYSLSMIPSQLVLMRIGAPRWLSIIVSCWGLSAMSFAFIKTKQQFYVLRMILGVAESGAFPGMWFYLNSFYPPDRITLPYSLIEAAVGVANVAGAPLAASLLMLDGLQGLRGWQWLFLLEGIPSVALGVTMRYVLPKDYHSAKYLNERQKSWLGQAMAAAAVGEAKEKGVQHAAEGPSSSRKELQLLREALGNGRIWVVAVAAVLKNAAMVGILFWAPLIVNALVEGDRVDITAAAVGSSSSSSGGGGGHGAPVSAQQTEVLAVLLTSIPFICAACCAVFLGHRSERRKEKAHHVAFPYFAAGALFISFPYAAAWSSRAAFVCLALAVTTLTAPNAILNSMASELGQGPAQALNLAVYNAIGNLGGLMGPFMVGRLVQLTGVYSTAMQALGLCIISAGSLAWYMKRWERAARVAELAA